MLSRKLFILSALILSHNTFASDIESTIKTVETIKKASQVANAATSPTADHIVSAMDYPDKIYANFTFSPMNAPFPMAYGLSGYYKAGDNWLLGGEYLRSNYEVTLFGFGLGAVKEQTYSFSGRRYFGNHFNLLMGFGQRNTKVQLPSNLFRLAAGSFNETASDVRTNYVRLGIGHSWKFKKRYFFSVDWATLNIPVYAKTIISAKRYVDPSDEDSIKTIGYAEGLLKYYPSWSIAQMNIGVVF